MTSQAFAAYLMVLADDLVMGRRELTRRAKARTVLIARLHQGVACPADVRARLVVVVGGDLVEAEQLYFDPESTVAHARRVAHLRLANMHLLAAKNKRNQDQIEQALNCMIATGKVSMTFLPLVLGGDVEPKENGKIEFNGQVIGVIASDSVKLNPRGIAWIVLMHPATTKKNFS